MKIIDVPQAILDHLSRVNSVSEWLTPEPIGKKLMPVPSLADDMLPPPLNTFVNDAAGRMQASREYVAVALIVALGTVIGTGCAVRPKQKDNWTVTSNVWGMLVGQPASKKSPALTAGLGPVHHLDHLAQKDFEAEYSIFYVQQLTRQLKVKELERKQKKSSLTPEEITELARASRKAEEPAPKRYYSNDATIEALGEILAVNPRGVLMVNDELSGWLQAMDKPGREGTRAAFLSAWNGLDPQRVDRIGRGNLHIPHFCISVLGGIQPDMIQTYLSEAQIENRNDGLVQRLQLAVYPDLQPIETIVDQSPDHAVITDVRNIFIALGNDLLVFKPNVDAPGTIPYFRFESKKAFPAFRDWLLQNEQRARSEESPVVSEHLSKFSRLVPALSLVFHMTRLATGSAKPGSPIDLESLTMALKWAIFLEAHARRIYSMAQTDKSISAGALGQKIKPVK